jgi:hypothetical protein
MLLTRFLFFAGLLFSVATLGYLFLGAAPASHISAALILCGIFSALFLYVMSRPSPVKAEHFQDILLLGMQARDRMDRISREFIARQE